MAKTPEGQAISEVSHATGGTTKGSEAAKMQSELTKRLNAEKELPNGGGSSNKTALGAEISEVARKEGGTFKGSESAKMQSELDKAQNAQQGTSSNNTTTDTKSPEGKNISEVMSAEAPSGGPQKGSTAAAMKSQVTKEKNAQQGTGQSTAASTNGGGNVASRSEQGQQQREENFQEAVNAVAPKMANAPETVTKEDGDLLHSREQRARGVTEKGGIASQAQHLAAENKA